MHVLMKNNKVIFKSNSKIEAIYEHQNYSRKQRVSYKQMNKAS